MTADQPEAAPVMTGWDVATGEVQLLIDRHAEGELDEPALLEATRAIAAANKVSPRNLRAWAVAEISKLVVPATDLAAAARPPPGFATDPAPSSQPAVLALVLEMIVKVFRARVTCSPEQAYAVALWIAGTWGLSPPSDPGGGPDLYPRLLFWAPAKRCGKTTALETAMAFSRRGLGAANISAAAFFRTIGRHRASMFIDEVDQFLKENRDLTSALNAGYLRSGRVLRTAEVAHNGCRTHEVQEHDVWGAVAMAAIGFSSVPSPLADRSLRVELARQPAGTPRVRLGYRELKKAGDVVTPSLMAHADALGAAMVAGVPHAAIPPGLNDRDADNWQPLVAIAALAGGAWPARAYKAAEALCRVTVETGWNERVLKLAVEWLREVRLERAAEYRAWTAGGRKARPAVGSRPAVTRPVVVTFLPSDPLAVWLLNHDSSGFSDLRDTGAVKLKVARALGNFGAKPVQRRVGGMVVRGYDVGALRRAWRSYGQ